MYKTAYILTLFAGLVLGAAGVFAQASNKCVINGTVTYQQAPCPPEQVRRPPTIQELNGEEKKRRAAAAVSASAIEKVAPAVPGVSSGFSCDRRRYCSQMTSCDEARYFLANCPGVKMDGDKNGIPCEQQWCAR